MIEVNYTPVRLTTKYSNLTQQLADMIDELTNAQKVEVLEFVTKMKMDILEKRDVSEDV